MKIPFILCVLLLVALASVAASAEEEEEEEDSCPNKYVEGGPSVLVDAETTGSIHFESSFFHQSFDEECHTKYARKYRTANGECNHVFNLGMAKTPFKRLLPAEYTDHINSPRSYGEDGGLLPSAADVSSMIHSHESRKDPLTTMFMQWGQFIDHDITLTPVTTKNKKTIKCCGPNSTYPKFMADLHCYPIRLSAFNDRFQGNCMALVRSLAARDANGHQKIPREQVNDITAFIDGSMIYGSSLELMNKLREKISYGKLGARMRTSGNDLLPPANVSACILRGNGDYCFLAGDPRVNVQPGLIVSHTMFVRLHNLIVEGLKNYSYLTTEEAVFQEARKIVIGIVQMINYNEWLPDVIGKKMMKQYSLKPGQRKGDRFGYNAHMDPRMSNAFSTAAFRFGHSNIPESLYIDGKAIRFRDLYFRPTLVFDNYEGVLWSLLDGSPEARSEKSDIHLVTDVTDHLFEPGNQDKWKPSRGLDLAALNIQRGRDHGLPSYNKYRKFCGLQPVTSFTEFGQKLGDKLRRLYRSVENIDLFVGGLLEEYEDKAHVGPTFACIIAQQFHALKFGDRFYFETDRSSEGFTDDQLNAIRKVTFADVCCLTSKLDKVPKDVFKAGIRKNEDLLQCKGLRKNPLKVLNFKLWQTFN